MDAAVVRPAHSPGPQGPAQQARIMPTHANRLLTELPDELLQHVFAQLRTPDLLRVVSVVCVRWGELCEDVLSQRCAARGWRLPRRPRNVSWMTALLPWRALSRSHACHACSNDGEFPVRGKSGFGSASCPQLCLICKRCALASNVQLAMASRGYHVDLIGITGRPLLPLLQSGRVASRTREARYANVLNRAAREEQRRWTDRS